MCLIPSSAHGTNAASAVMAGMDVVVVACDDRGNVDLDDLRAKLASIGDRPRRDHDDVPVDARRVRGARSASSATIVHDAGGQVYVDGANLNALVGLARPGEFGADVSHLNLHKTFCIPHGGGGPGRRAGRGARAPRPVPARRIRSALGTQRRRAGVGGAFGSAGILPIPWTYIAMMGGRRA